MISPSPIEREMKRRHFLKNMAATSLLLIGCNIRVFADTHAPVNKLRLTDEQWRARLTPEQYAVLRFSETEYAGSSDLNQEYRAGT
jgi:peptide-methionine (R)-S-oxide reductase